MVVFRQEIRRLRSYIIGWTVCIAGLAFFMIPVYYNFLDMGSEASEGLLKTISGTDFFESLGVGLNFLNTPLGIYSFLTTFFAVAAAIYGMNMGIGVLASEHTNRTAEYLYTKPCSRREIFRAKLAAVFCGVMGVGIGYILFSFFSMSVFRGDFDRWIFLLIAKSMLLICLLFAVFGMLIGTIWPHNRSPLLTAGLITLVEYCVTSASRVIGIPVMGYLSPFSFFTASDIAVLRFYEWGYLIWYMLLLGAALASAYRTFLYQDVLL